MPEVLAPIQSDGRPRGYLGDRARGPHAASEDAGLPDRGRLPRAEHRSNPESRGAGMRLEGVFSWEEPCKKPSSKTLDSGVPDLLTSEPRQRIAIKPSEI